MSVVQARTTPARLAARSAGSYTLVINPKPFVTSKRCTVSSAIVVAASRPNLRPRMEPAITKDTAKLAETLPPQQRTASASVRSNKASQKPLRHRGGPLHTHVERGRTVHSFHARISVTPLRALSL